MILDFFQLFSGFSYWLGLIVNLCHTSLRRGLAKG